MRIRFFLAVLVVFTLGCVSQGPSCQRPYSDLAGDCCLDENQDRICDRDKPVCTPPYMNVGNTCCLDGDENELCDKDEAPPSTYPAATTLQLPETTTSTTSSVRIPTTSTISQAVECISIYDCVTSENIFCNSRGEVVYVQVTPVYCREGKCVFRSSQEISAYPCMRNEICVAGKGCLGPEMINHTTTTLVYRYDYSGIIDRVKERANKTTTSTSTTTLPCFDSDGGLKYFETSLNASGTYLYNNTFVSTSEHCSDSKALVEYFCESGFLKSRVTDCPGLCMSGKCCKTESSVCSSNKECCSGVCASIGLRHQCISG